MRETTVPHKTSEQSSSSFNLSGADLDNVFSGSKRDLDPNASAQPITEQQRDSVEGRGSVTGFGSVQENLTFFLDVHSAESAVKSFEDNQGDSPSEWSADFQSANKEESSKSYDPFVASNIDLSSHIDSIFGAGKDENREKLADDLQPAQSVSHDWMQDDLWKNVDSQVSQQAVQLSSAAEATWMLEVSTAAQEVALGIDFTEVYQKSDLCRRNREIINELSTPKPGSSELYFPTKYSQGFVTQCRACLWKQRCSYWRNTSYTAMRFTFTTIIALLVGTMFWELGSKICTVQDLSNAMGAMYSACLFLGIQNEASVQPVVAVERTVFYRERAADMYAALPYAIGRWLWGGG